MSQKMEGKARPAGQIIILGMHRSGTSCLANLLHAMGAHFAEEGVENPTDNDENPKGFWEHPELRPICDRILQASGYEWWAVDRFRLDAVPPGVRDEALAAFRDLVARLDAHQPWFIKEPRLCFLLPAMAPALTRPVVVHMWRNPLEVALSLHNRNHFSLDFGIALWEAYVLSAFKAARGMPAAMLDYGRLLRSPAEEASRLLKQLALLGVRGLSLPAPRTLAEVVDPALHRSQGSHDPADFLSPQQMRLLRALESGDPAHPSFYSELSHPSRVRLSSEAETAAVLQILQKQASTARQTASIERRLAPLDVIRSGISSISGGLTDARGRLGRVESEVGRLREQVGRHAEYIEARDQRIQRTSAELAAKERIVAELSRRLSYERLPFYAKWKAGARLLGDPSPPEGLSRLSRAALYLHYRLLRWRADAGVLAEIGSSPLFDAGWYVRKNADVAREGMDPLIHYVDHGWREGRDPGPEFQTSYYLASHSDVSGAGINPLLHYLRHGRAEGRQAVLPAESESRAATPAAGTARDPRQAAASRRRIVIYTAIAGGYDELKVPEVRSERCDFVCFTDRDIAGDRGWQLRPMDYLASEPVRAARYVKHHPHAYFQDYEWSIWVDANLLIKGDLAGMVDQAEREGELFATFLHPHRDCIYAEAAEIVERKVDSAERVNSQVQRYKSAGYPPNNGLAETNVLVRRHNDPRVIAVNTDWWREIENGSHRDQVSLNFAAHKHLMKLGALARRGVSVRNDPRIARFLHGGDSQYQLPAHVAQAIENAPPPVPVWERRDGAGLVTPRDLAQYDSISVDIVVCVHNSVEDVRRCLESVAEYLRPNQRIVVVDDGSDAEAESYCREFAARTPRTLLVRHPQASGYTRAANAGLRKSAADYAILLNSDTIVTRDWASKLVHAGESAPDVGLVGPMSNAASWQSLPETTDGKGDLAVNSLPPGCTVRHMDQFCELWSQAPLFPRVALLNGFCLAIKRKVIETVGLFDEEAFPNGYGEENDYCFRAADAGFALVVATHTYVYHSKSRSYSHERRRELAKQGGAAFRGRYSAERISRAVASTRENPYLERLRQAARLMWPGDKPGRGLKLLFLLAARSGGGGVHSVMQEANGLRVLGAEVCVAVPAMYREDYLHDYPRELAAVVVYYESVDELVELAARFEQVIATIFNSMELLERVVEKHPELMPAYYIQDYEPYFFEKSSTRKDRTRLAAATRSYTALPDLLRFAKTAWLQNTLEEKSGGRTYRVQPSLDRNVYFPAAAGPGAGPVRIAAMLRITSPRRAPELTARILARVARAHGAAVSVHVFGTPAAEEGLKALLGDAPVTNHGILRREEVAGLLRESDVFVDFSEYQAFGRTALEAMACGCAAIVPRAGGADEFARDGFNALAVDTASEEACFEALDSLVRDRELRARLRQRALETAARYSVEHAAMSELLLLRSALALRATSAQPHLSPTAVHRAAPVPKGARTGSALPPEQATAAANHYLEPELSMFSITPDEMLRNADFVDSMRELKQVPSDRLLWLVPSFDNIYRGGIRTVFMVADHLARTLASRNLFVIYGPQKASMEAIANMAAKAFPRLKVEFARLAAGQHPTTLPPSDAAFATLWTSAYLLAQYDRCKSKFYLVQDFEPSFYPAGSVYGAIEQTYMLGFHGIANTIGVARRYRDYSEWVEFFTPGVDTSLFHPAPRRETGPFRIVFYGRPGANRNAFNLGIEALRQVKDYFGHNVDIVSVGGKWPEHLYGVDGIVRNLGVLSTMEEVAALYRSCDIGLAFMFSDHPSYQPLEFMASGCCTVTNFNPSTTWLLRDRENAFLTGAAPASVARCIIDALEDPKARARVVAGGLETVRALSWDDAMNRIAEFVVRPRPVAGEFRPPIAEKPDVPAMRQVIG
jgi:GT2 family glycosyltransferase/glycosyltransferase involved in cell wall biosynthesis